MVVERLLSTATFCAIIGAIAAFNEECRRFLEGLVRGDASTGFSALGASTVRVITLRADPVVSYAADHLGLVGFGVVALLLFGLMIKT
jgi:hypothetical protein